MRQTGQTRGTGSITKVKEDFYAKAQPRDPGLLKDLSAYQRVLDLGCGLMQLTGDNVITLDTDPRVRPKVLHDLTQLPWPFDDNTFDFIFCHQVLEHLPDTVTAVGEMLRIAMPGCRVSIGVPHFSAAIAYRDPTHKSFFSAKTFDYFVSKTSANYLASSRNKCFQILSMRITFSRLWSALGLSALFNAVPRLYEEKLHGVFPAKFILWELLVREIQESPTRVAA